MKIPINEIFISLDGEVNNWGQGKPTVFIRTQGCNLSCSYCDTPETIPFEKNKEMLITEIVDLVLKSKIRKVTITGGEPLIHFNKIVQLCSALITYGIKISIETNGTVELPLFDSKDVCFVVDFKDDVSSAGFISRFSNIEHMWVKFIIKDRASLIRTCEVHSFMRHIKPEWSFAMSPVHGSILEEDLLYWIIEYSEKFPYISEVVVNTQIHKLIFPYGEKNHVLS